MDAGDIDTGDSGQGLKALLPFSSAVPDSEPVGEPIQGIMPNRFNASTKKKIVHKNGTNRSAS